MSSKEHRKHVEYWKKREKAQRKKNIKDDVVYQKQIEEIYQNMLDEIQKEINGFYVRYAKKEGITIAEAKKRASKLDIEEYARKAKKYVAEKDFSDKANEEMRLYNLTMKVNRLELLKAKIGLELVSGFDELEKLLGEKLTEKTLEELERQAGILGKSIQDNAKAAHAIVNASFHNATFSDRIWMYQDMLKADLSKLLQQNIIQGKHPRELATHLRKRFGISQYNAERLMITESARIQTEAQKQSLERNGFEYYEYIACGKNDVCGICKGLDGKHFKVKDMMPGVNAPPLHPFCHCSTAAWEDSEEYEQWLEFLDKGGTTAEWEKLKKTRKSVVKGSGSGIMKLPRYENAIISKAKFTQYALNPEKDINKAEAFRMALGYTLENVDDLIKQIHVKLPEYNAVKKGDRGWGMTYEVVMNITGPNGKTAKVLTAWIDDKNSSEMRLTTVHVDK